MEMISMKNFTLNMDDFDDHMIESLVSGCPLIEDLGFDSCKGFEGLDPAACDINVASCKNIKDLSLNGVRMMNDWLCNLISELSILEFLSIFDCFELESFSISSPCLKELCLSGCRNLVEINIVAPNLRVFVYSGTMDEIINVPEELRLTLPSPLSTIKQLNSRSKKTEKITKVVDDLLWISPHTKTVSIKSSNRVVSSFEVSYIFNWEFVEQS
ncbi:hypothetical protein EZV62_004363 [Acer yangbiense]|uniref:At1g61320/AtMIF1 LRR domain-containing protein n=1 Tax=Acer yangbiense TaxID=1000413 RepID=A0A5C7IJR9_9ROSI|nr:hypothetical protein EZV62_004363 [Acer yangbiense]